MKVKKWKSERDKWRGKYERDLKFELKKKEEWENESKRKWINGMELYVILWCIRMENNWDINYFTFFIYIFC